ncbi:hypothetical protein WDJ51_03045 [Rathayibacter sp. YIM 133350]|uniref:hypothetical protein n=1 Tax=Rathayibacter sp. YIM 133350 TaxID=3131992 RepID=UPI00307D7379
MTNERHRHSSHRHSAAPQRRDGRAARRERSRSRAVRAASTRAGVRNRLALPAALAVVGLGAALAIAPLAPPTQAQVVVAARHAGPAQTITVQGGAAATVVERDGYSATTGAQTLIAGGTNYDWARLVMTFAGWPTSESNITVFTRWMRQENGTDDWWNRNNPLNNGWGSGGGSGLGSYDSLVTAAENCADALHRNSGYTQIAAGFASSAPTASIEQAIWASPWAGSHYANGSHWAYTPVPVMRAPADAW